MPFIRFRTCGVAATLALVMALCASASAQGIHVGLVPAVKTVAPDSVFTLDLQVTESGSGFNGFDVVVSYDPAALTFLPTSPTSLQQGTYMTGVCGNTFHLFSRAADSLSITSVLLCANQSLTGPGQVYRLRFRAASTVQETWVRVRRAQFYDAGVDVTPVVTADAHVGIGIDLAVPPPGARAATPGFDAYPNPSRGTLAFRIEVPVDGLQSLVVHDLQGRDLARPSSGWFPAGARQVGWDGRDAAGRALPPGLYLVTLRTAAGVTRQRVTLLH